MLARIRSADFREAGLALNDLCSHYHYPLYCFIRRRGFEHHDAQDALHDFLARLLEMKSLEGLKEEKGRLRGFLSTALQRFLITWRRDHRHQEKLVSFDAGEHFAKAEERYLRERLTDKDTPERLFARKWAQELLTRAVAKLREDYVTDGKEALFNALKPALMLGGSLRGEGPAAIAASLGMSEPALRKAMERLLGDYRDSLELEVAQTVGHNSDIAEEIAALQEIFRPTA